VLFGTSKNFIEMHLAEKFMRKIQERSRNCQQPAANSSIGTGKLLSPGRRYVTTFGGETTYGRNGIAGRFLQGTAHC
jgi:hypothetical protein